MTPDLKFSQPIPRLTLRNRIRLALGLSVQTYLPAWPSLFELAILALFVIFLVITR